MAAAVWIAAAPAATAVTAATDPKQKQEQVRRERRTVQKQLDVARASDARIEAEVDRLDAAVRRQQNRVDDAKRASVAAAARVADAQRELAAVEARAQAARHALVANAVELYMGGKSDEATLLATSRTAADAARRQMYLDVFRSRGRDVLDELHATIKDQHAAKAALEAAREQATSRADAEARLARRLTEARASHVAAQDALKSRIAELLDHSRQLAAQEAQIQAILQRASRSAGPIGAVSRVGLIWPLQGQVTSEYGSRWGGFHSGIDIAAPPGSSIRASKAGSVIFAGYNGGYGNFVIIDHGDGIATAYAHMSSIAMSEGQRVSQGQQVGTVGSTGHSTGPHLHFEVRVNGAAKNPRSYLP